MNDLHDIEKPSVNKPPNILFIMTDHGSVDWLLPTSGGKPGRRR